MLGVSHRVAKKWLEGEEFPPTSKMVKIATKLNVRSNWLFSGQGEKVSGEHAEVIVDQSEISRSAGELSQEAFEVASEWMRLPPQQRVAIRKVIKELGKVSATPISQVG
jgi:phage repressor protein C with HTH and peptisase S24 domain